MTAKHCDIDILGAGLAGIGMASRLRAAGRTAFVIFEQADRLGATMLESHATSSGRRSGSTRRWR